jgi:PAS domain S-box-containing protein
MFPCHFEVDADLTIREPGQGLVRIMGEACAGARLNDIFTFERSFTPASIEDFSRLRRSVILLSARHDNRLRLRGVIGSQADGRVLFLLSPILSDGATAVELGIDFNSLSPTDGSAELIMATEMQRAMTMEARELTARLTAARDEAIQKQGFFDTIIQMLPALLMVKNASDGRYLLLNKTAEDAMGLAAEDVIGRTVFDLFPADQAEKFALEDRTVVESGEMKVEQEELVTTRTRGERYFITRKVATYNAGEPRYVVTVGEDVTERREAAKDLRDALTAAEQASRSKGAFLANMSHEIRTPLNGIVAVADILSTGDLGQRERELVEIIRASSDTLGRLLSDILDLARVESGQIRIDNAPFHLGDVVRSTVALCRLRGDERGVPIEIDLSPDIDRMVNGDLVRVRQVVTNLLSNAVKFTQTGRITVTGVRTGAGLARLAVKDTGVGFDPEMKERIFGRFQQADDSITRKFGGTGLGLAISRDLADLMGGGLDCDSTPGAGSTFWFEAPLEPVDVVLDDAPPADASMDPDRVPRILLADDHPTNRKIVELMLEKQADVVSVVNGAEAVEAFRTSAFDVILMDMQMPVMDGLTAVRAIRRLAAAGDRIPIIMLTANALPEHVQASLSAGADFHLEKPFTFVTLTAAINEVLIRNAASQVA